jgi:hypothetical protein
MVGLSFLEKIMSHFTECEVNFLQKYEKDFIAALEKRFGKGNVEVHEEGAALYGYQGDNRANYDKNNKNYAPPCHIIIRRKHVGSASNDIGYRRTEDGGYVGYVSDYDKHATFSKAQQGEVAQEYALTVSEKKLKAEGWATKREVTEKGVVRIIGSKWTK